MSGQPASGRTPRRSASSKRTPDGKRGSKPAKKATAKKGAAKAKTGRASTTHGGPPRTNYRKIGRPTKRTPEVEAEILRALSAGLDYQTAAMAVAITVETLQQWRKAHPSFSADCEKAIAKARIQMAELAWLIAAGEAPAKGLACCIFWLKTRTSEFRERQELTPESADAVAARVREALAKEIPASDFEGGDGP